MSQLIRKLPVDAAIDRCSADKAFSSKDDG